MRERTYSNSRTDHNGFFRTISFGKFGAFEANELIGQPYGLTYEIHDKKLKAMLPKTMDEVGTSVHHTSGRIF